MQKSQGKEILQVLYFLRAAAAGRDCIGNSHVTVLLQVTIVDTTKKLMSYGPSMLDRMDAYWQNTDMAPLWVQEVYPKVANSIPCANRDQQARRPRCHACPTSAFEVLSRGFASLLAQLRALKFLSRAATSISDSDLVMKSIRGGGGCQPAGRPLIPPRLPVCLLRRTPLIHILRRRRAAVGNWSLSPLYSMLSCAAPGVLLSSHCPVTCTPS
jgi:hypothetical protein